jgi:tetratricopeptide (TPR) repeat protein
MAARLEDALTLHQAGRLAEAERLYREILQGEPQHFDALHFLGVAAYQQGRNAEAAHLISRAIAINGTYAPAHSNLANALEAAGEIDRALAAYRRALELQPDFVDALVNLGALHAGRGEHEAARECYERALALDPNQAVAHTNLGNVFNDLGRLDEAAACHQRALAIDPRLGVAHSNLGNVLRAQGRVPEALEAYRRALALAPDLAEAHANLGNVLADEGQLDEAIGAYRRALTLRPNYAEAHANLGNTLVQAGNLPAADASCREALRLKPDSAHSRFTYALLRLLEGDYATGLPLYESRFEEKALSRLYSALHSRAALLEGAPRWRGEDGAGRRLLVWTDQGLGDSLMMLRYLPLLKRRGFRQLVVYCEPELARVVQADVVVSSREPMPVGKFDCHIPIMSLPLAFATRVDSIPNQVPYIQVPENSQREWGKKLSALPRPRVGLLWAGGALYPRNRLRSIRLKRLEAIVRTPGISFVSLQKGEEAYQAAESGWRIADFMSECRDLLDTAALIENLDLVIGVDSAVAHLTGAVGKPMWMMNRFESEWRWLLGREDSPWYPTIRILRQPRPADWDSVIRRAAVMLADHDFGIGRH